MPPTFRFKIAGSSTLTLPENSSLTKDNKRYNKANNNKLIGLINFPTPLKRLPLKYLAMVKTRIAGSHRYRYPNYVLPRKRRGAILRQLILCLERKYFRPYFTSDADRCAVTIHGDRHERPAIVLALRTPLITPTISFPLHDLA